MRCSALGGQPYQRACAPVSARTRPRRNTLISFASMGAMISVSFLRPSKGFPMRKPLVAVAAFVMWAAFTAAAFAQSAQEFVHEGTLRVGVLAFNPVLASTKPDGTLAGVSVDLGSLIAAKLGVRVQF